MPSRKTLVQENTSAQAGQTRAAGRTSEGFFTVPLREKEGSKQPHAGPGTRWSFFYPDQAEHLVQSLASGASLHSLLHINGFGDYGHGIYF